MPKDIMKGLDPEVLESLREFVNRAVAVGPITYKQVRESGIIGRKYPYDQVAQAINSLPETEITEKNIGSIIHKGWMWSGKVVGIKKLSKMVINPKAKDIILRIN